MPAPEAGQEGPDHPDGESRRMNDPASLVGIEVFRRFRILKPPQFGSIGNAGPIQDIFQQLVFQLQIIQLLLEEAYIYSGITHFLLPSRQMSNQGLPGRIGDRADTVWRPI
jgi:hypothetical protein